MGNVIVARRGPLAIFQRSADGAAKVYVGNDTANAARFAAVAEAKVALAQGWAQSIAPRAYVNIENPTAGQNYPADYNIANGLTFLRFTAELVGSGTAQIAVIANGIVYGPVTIDDDGLTAPISITIPAGNDISFSVPSITGSVSFIHASIDGDAA